MAVTSMASVELSVGGMTCTSCAARIEKNLNQLDGVTASVNYATEQASVRYDTAVVAPADLIASVEATGYRARVPAPRGADDAQSTDPDAAALSSLRTRLVISAALTLPVLGLAMIPAAQFDRWQWLS